MSCIPVSRAFLHNPTVRLDGVDFAPVYNTLNSGARLAAPTFESRTEDGS